MRLIARKGKLVCALLTVILSGSFFCSAVWPASSGQRLAAGLVTLKEAVKDISMAYVVDHLKTLKDLRK
jgi:hypothetical protein